MEFISIRSKILLPLTMLLFVFFSIFLYALAYFSNSQKKLNEEITRIKRINDTSMQVAVLRQKSRNNLLNYRVNKNPAHLKNIDYIQADVNLLLEEIRPLVTNETGKTLLKDFEDGRDDVMNNRNLLITAIKNSQNIEAEKQFRIWNIKVDNNYASLLDFINHNDQLFHNTYHIYENLISRIFIFQMAFTLLMALLIVGLYFYLRQTITRPLKKLTQFAHNITYGNFDFKNNVNSNDEIGHLSRNLNIMSKSLLEHQKNLLTNVKRKEIELKRLKKFETQKDNFLSVASHELKTPITSIKVLDQLLLRETAKYKHNQYKTYLIKMDEQVNKLTRLIISLLEVAKMQIGKIPFNMGEFDLSKVINESSFLAQERNKKYNIKVLGKIDRKIYGDKDRITQVFENLLSNAIKYSPQNKNISVRLKADSNRAIVSVRDHGIGISKTHQSKIFKRFYRVSETHDNNTYPGFGIGLYISREIIKRHGGKLWVNSKEGKGSIFSFSLPIKSATDRHRKN